MTYEVIKKEIRGGEAKKEYNLFDTKSQATKYLQAVIRQEHGTTVGSIKDGHVRVFDTDGVMRREYEINSF